MDIFKELDDDFDVNSPEETDELNKEEYKEKNDVSLYKFVNQYEQTDYNGQGDPNDIIKLIGFEEKIRSSMVNNQDVILLNRLQPIIETELHILFKSISYNYKTKFNELGTLIPDMKNYVKVVNVLETSEPINLHLLDNDLTKEQLLLLSMEMEHGFLKNTQINKILINKCIESFYHLLDLQNDVSEYVTRCINRIAPNTCAILGPKITSNLLAHTGGIFELSQLPSCNLASIGKKKYLSYESHTNEHGVRQTGFIFQSDIIQDLPESIQKKALRMVCSKVALCSRIDASYSSLDTSFNMPNNNNDASLGLKWKREILDNLIKTQETPNSSHIKPLPIPEDKYRKKRAGRRFRKYKEQFKLSYMRQLQNRVEFGKEEQVTMDYFGEEIGLGMSKSVQGIVSFKNNPRLRKHMKERIKQTNKSVKDFLNSDHHKLNYLNINSETTKD